MNGKNNGQSGRGAVPWVIVGVLAAVAVTALVLHRRSSTVPVRVAEITRQTLVSAISTNGKIEPVDSFEAHAPLATTVKRVLVKEGDHVQVGQLLVELEDATALAEIARAQAQLAAAQADLHTLHEGGTREEILNTQQQLAKARTERDLAQRNLEAMQRLLEHGAASPEEVRAARLRVTSAQSEVKTLQEKLSSRYSGPDMERVAAQAAQARATLDAANDLMQHSAIRAPRAGEVYSVPVHDGQFVNPGDLLVAVANLDKVAVRAFVDEPDIGRLTVGSQVIIAWDAFPGQSWEGTVSLMPTTVVQRGTRTVGETTCVINNPGHKLLPAVDVNVSIVTAKREDALTLPREAVHQDANGQRFVYSIDEGRLNRHDVQTGISNMTSIEITQGLADHALVALGALSNKPLHTGMEVEVVR